MPYIKQNKRPHLDLALDQLFCRDAAELTYALFKASRDYFEADVSYQRACEIMGALRSVENELYRRHIAPYEDTKLSINGDA